MYSLRQRHANLSDIMVFSIIFRKSILKKKKHSLAFTLLRLLPSRILSYGFPQNTYIFVPSFHLFFDRYMVNM